MSYNVTESKKPHTIIEDLIKPWLQKTTTVLGKEISKKLELGLYQIMLFKVKLVIKFVYFDKVIVIPNLLP